MKRAFLSLFLVFGVFSASFAANNTTDVYLLAKTESTSELQKVENIDVVDSDGNTALCSAIKYDDVDAYNILKKAGANTEHKCVKKIPSEQYKTFLQKVGAANKSWSFLGLGKWAWAAIGAGVAGGAVAAGMGGGGSGGSSNGGNGNNICQNQGFTSHEPCVEEDGWIQDRFCEDNNGQWYKCRPADCFGYQTSCGNGYEEVPGHTCKSGDEIKVSCQLKTCPYYTTYCATGYHETGNTCQSGGTIYTECEADTCEGYNYIQCPSGYVASDTCLSGYTTKYKCETPATCPYNTTECTGGYQETGNTCQSGETLYKECEPKTCPYTTTSCPTGFYGTGNTCLSGENTYVECAFDSEHYIQQGGNVYPKLNCAHGNQVANSCSCETGWSGTLCNIPATCPYTTQSCGTGYVETGNTCQSGNTTYIQCEPVNCPYTTTSCTTGFHATGNTCQSGEVTYVQCEPNACDGYDYTNSSQCPQGYTLGSSCLSGTQMKYMCDALFQCPYTTTECTNGYVATGNTCQSGTTTYVQCEPIQCGAHASWQGTGCACESGYQNYTSGVGCFPISCGVNATQNGTECVCNPDYQDWEPGYGCHQTLNCGVHATQVGDACVCNSGYQEWTEGYGCYQTLNCGEHATQSGNNCVCNSGYQNWTSGYGCYEILDCGANAHQTGANCVCNSGYQNWTSGVGCELTPINCGVNAVQNGTHCECMDGFSNWQPGIGCYLYGILGENGTAVTNNSTITINNNSGDQIYPIFGIKLTSQWSASNLRKDEHNNPSHSSAINITNEGTNDIYGIHYTSTGTDEQYTARNAYISASANINRSGDINITNTGDGNIYGLYGKSINAETHGAGGGSGTATANGNINIINTGDGNVYGMYNGQKNAHARTSSLGYNQSTGYYSYAGSTRAIANGNIVIQNTGDGDVFGMYGTIIKNASVDYAQPSTMRAKGVINISNVGNGSIYGMYGTNVVNANSYIYVGPYQYPGLGSDYFNVAGQITITNDGTGNSYGMYTNSGTLVSSGAEGIINGAEDTYVSIINKNIGMAYGMYNGATSGTSTNGSTDTTGSSIIIQNLSSGDAIGMYANGGTLTNAGIITINNIGTGTAIGMLGDTNSTINNRGTINITRDAYTLSGTTYTPTADPADNVFGIYARSGSTVNNSGTINVASNGGMFGIYAESGASVSNSGTISLNNVPCNGAACSGSFPYIVLNGGTLYNSGLMMAPQMNLNSMGGNVVAGLGSQFVVENELSGTLNISSELVQSGNQTTYIAENMIDAGDISSLNVRSASAMFDASVAENGHDVVMQMKDFDDLTDNKSLAAFLANNYANGKGQDLFSALKSMDNMSAFNGTLSGLTGLNTFTQFAHEDLSAMREISFSMNNKLFENSDRDSFDISDSTGYFSFSNSHNSGSGQYGISSEKIAENWKLGYGMAMANINTGDGDNMHRQNKMWLFYMPATYTNDGYELVVAPKAGFANSEYSRRGYNNINYEGYIEKRIFGLMNDLRYPLSFGNWTLAPDLAFNAIVYTQSGHEDDQEFSLVIPDDRTVSVETGLGLYTKYEKTFESGSRLKLNTGLMAYREFGDSYNLKLGIQGMDGTFNLYNNDYKYRGAASMGVDYLMGRFHLYGNAQYFMDNDNYMNFKGGVSYRF